MSTSISYDEIYSRFLTKASAYDLIMGYIKEETQLEFMSNWLHTAIANPQIRRIFTSVSMDDEVQSLTYEIKNSVDDFTDNEFVIEICAQGLLIAWISPKVNNITNMEQMISDADKKFYSQASFSAEMRNIQETAEIHLTDLLARRGGYWNVYLSGESASSTLRSTT